MTGLYLPTPPETKLSQPFFEPTTGQAYGAQVAETLSRTPITSGITALQIGAMDAFGREIDYNSAKDLAEKRYGVQLDNEDYHNTTYQAVSERARLKSLENRRANIKSLMTGSTALSAGLLATDFALQFIDFGNIATAMIPVTRAPAIAAGVSRFGAQRGYMAAERYAALAARQPQTYAQLMKRGAIEGAVGNAIVEGAVYPLQSYIGSDYTMADSLASIAMGAPFGAVLHAAPKAVKGVVSKYKARRLREHFSDEDLADYKLDAPTSFEPLPRAGDVAGDIAAKVDNDIADIAGELGIDLRAVPRDEAIDVITTAASRAESPEVSARVDAVREQAKELEPDTTYLSTAKDLKKYVAAKERGRVAKEKKEAAKVDMLGGKKERTAQSFHPRPTKQFLKKLGGVKEGSTAHKQLVDANIPVGGVVSPKGKITSLDSLIKSDYDAFMADRNMVAADDGTGRVEIEWLKAQMQDEEAGKYPRTEKELAAEQAKAQRDELLDLLDAEGVDVFSAAPQQIADAISSIAARDIVEQADDAAELVNSVSGQTRATAFNAALAQAANGRPINIEPILHSDPRSGKPPPATQDILRMAEDEAEAFTERQAIQDVEAQAERATQDSISAAQKAAEEDIPFSRGDKDGVDAKVLEGSVRESFGKHTAKMMDESRLGVVQSVSDLPKIEGIEYPADVRGVKTPDGRVYIVADNVKPEEVRGLILHEVGVHVGMRGMLGDQRFEALLSDITSSSDPAVIKARSMVPSDTPAHQVAEETLAYMVQETPWHDKVSSLLGAIRAWVYRVMGGKIPINQYTLRHMALGALKRVSKMGEGKSAEPFFSKTEKTSAGDQMVLEGAERISDKQLAERKMEQALKAKRPQKEMDIGLFGDDAKQTTLFFSRGSGGGKSATPNAEQLRAGLQDVMAPFINARKEAEKYPEILRGASQYIGNNEAMAAHLKSSGIRSDEMISNLIGELSTQHKKVGNSLRKMRRQLKEQNKIQEADSDDDVRAIAAAAAIEKKILISQRQAAIDFVARQKMLARVRSFGEDFYVEGLLSLATGSEMLRFGARDSAAARQLSRSTEWADGLKRKMRKEGVWEVFLSGDMDAQIFKAHSRLYDDNPDLTGINANAVKIAKAMFELSETMRLTQNDLGAFIPKLRDYITHQSHDQAKIYNAGFEQWRQKVEGWFDFRYMPKTPKFLKELYTELATGTFEADLPTSASDNDFRIGANVAKRVSMSRQIVFKEGAWLEYNKEFGQNTLANAYMRGINRAAEVSGVMSVLGTNPMSNIKNIVDQLKAELKASGNLEALKKLNEHAGRDETGKIYDNIRQVDGTANIAANINMANIESGIGTWNMVSKLGGAIVPSTIDLATYAAGARFQGRGNMFSNIGEAIGGMLKSVTNPQERQEILELLEVYLDHSVAQAQKFDRNGTLSQNLGVAGRYFGWLNFQTPWTMNNQRTAVITTAQYIGRNAKLPFADLPDGMKRMFTRHGIDEAKWDAMRHAVRMASDGRSYITPEQMRALPDNIIESYLGKRGASITPESIRKAKESLMLDYRTMISDEATGMVISSDKRSTAAVTFGTQKGTPLGTAVRLAGQFKSYPVTFWQRVIRREVYGRGYDSVGDYIKNGKSDMLEMASFMATLWAFGYGVLSVKELLKGRTPPPLSSPKTYLLAAQYSGMLGLYGDTLLREYGRSSGQNLAEVLVGPTLGTVGDILEITSAAANGDKYATSALRLLINNTPGANLIYVKPVLDYGIMYSLMEQMNPGYLRRMEANAIRDTGQTWLIRPSEMVR